MVFSFLSFQNPRQYKIPDWFLNRQRDIKDGKTNQVFITNLLHITVLQSITCVRSWRMCWTTSSVRILSAWRRFEPTGVLGTTGALGWVWVDILVGTLPLDLLCFARWGVSTPRPLVTRERRLVCQRRSRQHLLFLEDNKLCLFRPLLCFLDAALHHEHSLKAEQGVAFQIREWVQLTACWRRGTASIHAGWDLVWMLKCSCLQHHHDIPSV